jgi:hypothetical protein
MALKSFTLAAAGTLIVAVAFLAGRWLQLTERGSGTSSATGRYQLYEFRPKTMVGVGGIEENRLFKINVATGETWELATWDVPTGLLMGEGKTGTQRVTGWEPVSPDYDQAIQETWRKFGTPPPQSPAPNRSPR